MGATVVVLLMLSISRVSAVTVGEDGGYDGVVVRVGAGVKEEHCLQLIRGLKTILDLGSSSLANGLEGRAYLASVTLVLPPNWRDSMCGLSMASPSASMPWRKPDLLVESSEKMEVLRGAQCGQPGELVRLPLTQLLGNVTVEDGRRLARAWAGLRYGVFPEMEEEDSDRELFPNTTRAFGQQSVLCQGRAIREVILGHDDFKEVRLDGEPERNVVPQLVVVREPAPKVVLALETSSMMAEGESWRWIHKAAHRFLRHQLPVNSALALITFSGRRVTLEQPLIQVTSQAVRARLADTIPGKYHLATDTTLPCIGCVLEETVENVLHHDTAGAHLVLITSGKMDPEEQEWVEEQVARSNLQVSVISLSSSHLKFYDMLSTLSGGQSSLLPPSARGLERLHSLNGAFSRVAHEEEVEVHSQPIYTSSGLTEGTFVIDETLGRDTVFGILVEDEEDHLVRSVSFTDARGSAYGPYTKMSSTFDPVNLKTINYVGRAPPFGDAGLRGLPWQYTLEWSPASSPRHSMVVVTSKPAVDAILPTVRVWVRGHAVFAEVREIRGAVEDATVTLLGLLEVDEEGEEGRSMTALPGVTMSDDGSQEPDLTAGDGVYSTFLPSPISAGRLTLSVQVTTASNSHLPDLSPVPGYSRKVVGPVLQLEAATENPPGRVRDFHVALEENNKMSISWSSPGGNYKRGQVVAQRVLFSSSINELLRGEGEILFAENRTREAGSLNKHMLPLPLLSAPLHLAVVAIDSSGLQGAVSNIVTVDAPEEEVEELASPRPSMSGLLLVTERDWVVMGVIAGALLVLLLSLAASLAYCYCLARAKPPPRAPSTTSTTHEQISAPSSSSSGSGDEESLHSEMKVVAPQQPLPYHDFAKSLDMSQASSPASTATPLYWSASQLLSKLDSPHPSLDYRVPRYPAPPEFSVTVASLPPNETGNHSERLECEVREVNESAASWHHRHHRHPPPPLFPKPKNVTQV